MNKKKLRKVIDNHLVPLLPASKKVVLWELPYHTNLGDTLIWQGEECFFADNNIDVIDRNSFHVNEKVLGQKIDKDVTIFLHGGGNFGDIWDGPMEFRRKVIAEFTENPIVLFPQTVFYQNQELVEKDAELFGRHENLTLCARDKFSYDFLTKYFSKNNILMMPDMAFCIRDDLLASSVTGSTKSLFGARIDKELNQDINYDEYLPRVYDTADWPSFEYPPKEYDKLTQLLEDNKVVDDFAFAEFMPAMVKMGVDFISEYKDIFSTRLHIAILSILLNKKITWFDNSYGKNSDFYETWLKSDKNINFIYSDAIKEGRHYSFDKKLAIKRATQEKLEMQSGPLVSVIIPVYNVERYLVKCVDTVRHQSYKNIEIILVDDESLDSSGEVCDGLATQDKRIRVIHKRNEGLNMARATGVGAATGSLITFIDSDDMVHADYIMAMYRSMKSNDVDIVVCGYRNFLKNSEINTRASRTGATNQLNSEHILKDKDDILKYFLGQILNFPNVYHMTAWGKLIESSIVKGTDWKLSNYRRHEDNLETLQWYSNSKKGVAVIPETCFYFYRKNPESITQKITPNKNPDGRALNYFEFIAELYQKTKVYINDDTLNLAILRSFADSNRYQLYNYFTQNYLDEESAATAMKNSGDISNIYEQEIGVRDDIIRRQEEIISSIQKSRSWRLTEPIRRLRNK